MALVIDGANNTISASPAANVVFQSNVVFSNTTIFAANATFTTPATFSANVTFSGTVAGISASGALINVKFLTTGTTYTVPSNVTRVFVEAVGGGASGAAGSGTAGGGGGGGYAAKLFVVVPSSTCSYTIGTGGTGVAATNFGNAGSNTTFSNGTFAITATGGGTGGYYNSPGQSAGGGNGGAGANGDINIVGGPGGPGYTGLTGASNGGAGHGGSSMFAPMTTGTGSQAGNLYGGGSSGGVAGASSTAGAQGAIKIWEFA